MRTAAASLAVSCILLSLQPSVAQDVVRIGFSVPLTPDDRHAMSQT
jgi:anti-anti-sigma regulatory factor